MNSKDKNVQESRQYVIQKHSTAEDIHWDFMLEKGDLLVTFRLDKSPEKIPCEPAYAVKIFNHPLRFLTYEGKVNNGTGQVCIADAGTYIKISENDCSVQMQLAGRVLQGEFLLKQIDNDKWKLSKITQTD